MNSLTKKITINASLEQVWSILADVARTPEWVDGVKESERTGAVKEGQGLRWREACVLDRQHIDVEHEMTVWEPMKKAVIRSVLPMNGSMTRTLGFTEKQEGAEVSVEFVWDLGIAGMILGEQKVRTILDQSFENTLANWKDLAEKK
ncbi:MAG: SRPBCC family protein [Candidatus Omnitrophica bacterium]|nr:SRPBCC family protein [Candidatus Omnitrophota bacterium]